MNNKSSLPKPTPIQRPNPQTSFERARQAYQGVEQANRTLYDHYALQRERAERDRKARQEMAEAERQREQQYVEGLQREQAQRREAERDRRYQQQVAEEIQRRRAERDRQERQQAERNRQESQESEQVRAILRQQAQSREEKRQRGIEDAMNQAIQAMDRNKLRQEEQQRREEEALQARIQRAKQIDADIMQQIAEERQTQTGCVASGRPTRARVF